MVRDNVTGLIWEVKTDDGSVHDKDRQYTCYDSDPATNGGNAGTPGEGTDTEDFINALNDEKFGGYSDWRMPTREELRSIADYGRYHPAINDNYFPNAKSSQYWSSSSYAKDPGIAWIVNFHNGLDSDGYAKSNAYYVRAVRGGQSRSFGHLVINGDGTVTDTETGLMWQQNGAESEMIWKESLAYCEDLSLAGHEDWRMPTIRELSSLADLSKYLPAAETEYFPDTKSSDYWSSSFLAGAAGIAWTMHFYYGDDGYYTKSFAYPVRAVRGGQSQLFGHLVISSPNQGSYWGIGGLMPIRWETEDITGNVSISLSRDGGKEGTFETITESTENDGTYDWMITGPASVNCVLKIEPLNEPSKGTTQGMFTIREDTAVRPIPDTGQTKCYDNEKDIPCPQPGEDFYGQDAHYTINPPSYTKLDADGNDLSDDAEEWVMVRDNVTGLIWEVKHTTDSIKADYNGFRGGCNFGSCIRSCILQGFRLTLPETGASREGGYVRTSARIPPDRTVSPFCDSVISGGCALP